MRLKPPPGRVVIDPDHQDYLPAEGRETVMSAYWRRRWKDGDVVEATDGEAVAPAAAASRKGAPE